MYKLYETFCEEKEVVPEKESFYKHVFTCFNLSFKRPKTDTCDICDKYTSKIDHGTEEEKEVAKNEKELHLRRAEAARLAKDTAS